MDIHKHMEQFLERRINATSRVYDQLTSQITELSRQQLAAGSEMDALIYVREELRRASIVDAKDDVKAGFDSVANRTAP